MLPFVSACVWHCSSFYFAKGWHFVCRFIVRLMSVVSSNRVAPNVQVLLCSCGIGSTIVD